MLSQYREDHAYSKSMILNLGYTNSDMINYYFHFSILFKYAVKGATILENPFTTFDIS